jgi:chromosome segregation ATPase
LRSDDPAMKKPSYLAAAFNARPLGMPIPPNWFGVAAFGLLGALVNPGLWLIGLGLEGLYLWTLSRNRRFRNAVDANAGYSESASRYESLLAHLDRAAQSRQYDIEREAAEIVGLLQRSQAHDSQIGDVRQMAWLHLKMLSARASFHEVVDAANRERRDLEAQEQRCRERLADADDELRRSLEQQLEVIQSRRRAHADAQRRLELVDAELGRLRQQVSLVREQALLATDENSIAHSLDALSASLNEANRWLRDQRELFAGLEIDEPPPADLLASKRTPRRASKEYE